MLISTKSSQLLTDMNGKKKEAGCYLVHHESFFAIYIHFKITAPFHIVHIKNCESPPQIKRSCNLKRFVKDEEAFQTDPKGEKGIQKSRTPREKEK